MRTIVRAQVLAATPEPVEAALGDFPMAEVERGREVTLAPEPSEPMPTAPPVPTAAPSTPAAPSAPSADSYSSKLVKYVPAEVIAFYVPAYLLVGGTRMGAMLTLLIGAGATFLYLELQSRRESQPQPWTYYLLAVVAFLGWALGTSTIGKDLLGLSIEMSAFIMLVTVLAIPALDGLNAAAPAPRPAPTS